MVLCNEVLKLKTITCPLWYMFHPSSRFPDIQFGKKKKSQTRSLSFALLQMAISQNRWVVNANVPHAVRKVLREKNGHFPQLALPSILPLRADGCWCLCRACPGFTRCFNCCNELHFAHQFHSICATGDNEMAMCRRGAQQTTTLRPTTV